MHLLQYIITNTLPHLEVSALERLHHMPVLPYHMRVDIHFPPHSVQNHQMLSC